MMCHGDPALRIDGDVTPVPELVPGTTTHLSQNFPNPFNPRTTIAFDLPQPVTVSLRVFDMAGRMVKVLLENESGISGRNEVVWKGQEQTGSAVAAGVYFHRLKPAVIRRPREWCW